MQKALAVFAIAIVVAICSFFGFQLERAGTRAFWLLTSVPTCSIAAIALYRAHADGEVGDWMRPRSGDFSLGFLGAGALFGLAYAFTKIAAHAGSPRESWLARMYLQLGHPGELRAHVAYVAAVIICASAAEEIVWRGLVTRLLAEQFGSRRAWIYSAVAYAAAHVPTMWALRDPVAGLNPVLPAAALGGGLVWGALARGAGRLPPAIVAHALFDWVVVMMFRLWGPSV